jgi:hypothetical protein
VYAPFDTELRSYVGRNNIAPNVINRRSRRNTLRYYALRLLSSEAPYRRRTDVYDIAYLMSLTWNTGLER